MEKRKKNEARDDTRRGGQYLATVTCHPREEETFLFGRIIAAIVGCWRYRQRIIKIAARVRSSGVFVFPREKTS